MLILSAGERTMAKVIGSGIRRVLWVCGVAMATLTCSGPRGDRDLATQQSAIIFDQDDRIDTSQISTLPLTAAQQTNVQAAAHATAILVDQSAVSCPASGACTVTIGAPSFNNLPLCADQKFAGQQ